MTQLIAAVLLAVVVAAPAGAGTLKIVTKCPPDAILVGQTCVDTYEASVWTIPNPTTTNKGLVTKVLKGKVETVTPPYKCSAA